MADGVGLPAALQAMCDSMPHAVFIADPAGNLVHTSRFWQQVWGLGASEGLGAGWLSVVHPDDRARVAAEWNDAVAAGRSYVGQYRILRADDTVRLVRVTADVIRGVPDTSGYLGAVADLTELLAAEAALGEERNRLTGILEGTRAGTWEWNVATGEFRVNERWVNILGWTREEWEPTTLEHADLFTHPEDKVASDELLERHFAGELAYFECESRMKHRRGHWVWVLDRGRVVTRTPGGKPEWMLGTHLEITSLKEQERELRRTIAELEAAHRRIEVANDSGGIGVWEFDLAAETLLWDTQMCRLYGLAAHTTTVTADFWEQRVDPRDRNRLARETELAITGAAPFDTEFRIILPDGGLRYLRSAARLIRDDDDAPRLVVGVNWDVTEARTLASDLEYRASHDELTGLMNRSAFDTELRSVLDRVHDAGGEHTLLYIDLDQFKVVNDACGHSVGDRLLREVAELLSGCLRDGDVLARLGGDEFGALLTNCDAADGHNVASALCRTIESYRLFHAGVGYRVGASVGLVQVDAHWSGTQDLIQAADSACYVAKDAGRNRVFSWQSGDSIIRNRTGHTHWAARLGEALDSDGFALFGQRIVPLTSDDRKLWVEVLLRLPTPSGEYLTPGHFLPAAELFDLSTRIDHWVLHQVLQRMAGLPDLSRIATVTVNLSARATADPVFHGQALELLAGAAPGVVERLCLEISESASATAVAAATPFVEKLRGLGARIALDDFGSGLSSFSFLRDLPVDLMKIDGQFISGVIDDPIDDLSVRSFVELANLVGIPTVAEQVADPAVLERVRELGIDFGQGYLLHRPELLDNVLALPSARIPVQGSAPVPTDRAQP